MERKTINYGSEEVNYLLQVIGMSTLSNNLYKEKEDKKIQIDDYLVQLHKAVSKVSQKKTIQLVDCGSGKSYLSFMAYYYFKVLHNYDVHITCVDYNEHVVNKSREAAEKLGFNDMTFINDNIFDVEFKDGIDIIYSLHACNGASDMVIAKGILERAKYIFSVSCCQHDVRNKMRRHPLGRVTKFGVYKDRLADMISDSLRAMKLEEYGYNVSLFEFTSSASTPKNIMVRGIRGPIHEPKSLECIKDQNHLLDMFSLGNNIDSFIASATK